MDPAENNPNPNPEPKPNPNPEPTAKPEPTMVPVGELVGERKKRQDLEKRLAELEAEAKKRADAELTETQRLQARVKALEPLEGETAGAKGWAEKRRDAALKAMPKATREKLEAALEGLSPFKALDLIETFAAEKPEPGPTPAVERGAPSSGTPAGAPRNMREYNALPFSERQKWLKRSDFDVGALPD